MNLRALLGAHGFRPSKKLGQNFLIDESVPGRIAEASGAGFDSGVLEIGPGAGALTLELAPRCDRVVCLELDPRLIPVLRDAVKAPNVIIQQADILGCDLEELTREYLPQKHRIVCANLPYYITTPAIIKLVGAGLFNSITVMVQKEVAQRLCAAANTPQYGSISLFVQYRASPVILFDVPPESFYPKPQVTSSVIRMDRLESPPVLLSDEEFFNKVVRAAFAHRRKTLANCLCMAFGCMPATVFAVLEKCGIDIKIRGEALTLEQFAQVSNALLIAFGLQ